MDGSDRPADGGGDFHSAVKGLVAARDHASIEDFSRKVRHLVRPVTVPSTAAGKDYREYRVQGGLLEDRLAWIAKNADPVVTSNLELVMTAVGLDTSKDSIGYFLRHCSHATEHRESRKGPLPDRYLSPPQLKGPSANAFRKMIRKRKLGVLGPKGQYPWPPR